MSIVRHRVPAVDAPRNRSDLRAVAGLLPHPLVTRAFGSVKAVTDQLRVARLDGAIVGACRITPEVLRLGESRLKLGVIRNLAVHPQLDALTVRNALLEDAGRFMREHRYHLALATGSEFELRRFGYSPVFEQRSFRLVAHASSELRWDLLRVRPAKHGDIPAMSRLYATAYENIPGSLLRSRAHMARIWSEYEAACVITDREGKVLAYFVPRVSGADLVVVECAWSDVVRPAELKALLWEFADVAECAGVIIAGPRPVLHRLEPGARLTHADGIPTGFAACVDVDELFQSMIPEWENLLAGRDDAPDQELTVMLAERAYRIRSHHGAVTVDTEPGANKIALRPADLTHALLGMAHPETILDRERRILNAAVAAFFRVLFPFRNPAMSAIDLL